MCGGQYTYSMHEYRYSKNRIDPCRAYLHFRRSIESGPLDFDEKQQTTKLKNCNNRGCDSH